MKMSVKLLEYLPLTPGERCRALGLPSPACQVTRMSLPSLLIDLRSASGLPPLRYSQRLLQPSLSESVLATFGSNGSKPYCCFQLLGIPSPTALKLGSRLVILAETVPPDLASRAEALVMTGL